MKTGTNVTIKAGFGFWDTTRYPRGGCFRRSDGTITGEVTRAVATYSSGEPREVEIRTPSGTACVEVAHLEITAK